jgi:pimeloyl-ACP methyl ester carboxylesterase
MPHADLGDVSLFFTDEGSGDPPMLFVHGFSCDSHDWIWQLAHCERARRVIAVDLRGHGRSTAPDDGYTARQFAADLAALLEQLGTGPVVAVGHSMGGAVVTVLAVEHPESVAAVVTIDPAYLTPDDLRDTVAGLKAYAAQEPVAGAKAMLGGLYSPASPPALRTWHLRRVEGVPPHVLDQSLAGMDNPAITFVSDSVPYLRRRACPVLAVWADGDRSAVEAELFQDPRSKAIAFPGSGHWLHQERPAEFNAVVDAWLASL